MPRERAPTIKSVYCLVYCTRRDGFSWAERTIVVCGVSEESIESNSGEGDRVEADNLGKKGSLMFYL